MENIYKLMQKFSNWIHYYRSSIYKNVYRLNLIGEQLTSDEATILFKIKGDNTIETMTLSQLLGIKLLLNDFSPQDAARLGTLAFNELILGSDKDEKLELFKKIRHNMLNSLHDHLPTLFPALHMSATERPACLQKLVTLPPCKNKYAFNLVGFRTITHGRSMIVYTIFGKRDGYSKKLKEVIADKAVLSGFHPREAIKFGFIASGEDFFLEEY